MLSLVSYLRITTVFLNTISELVSSIFFSSDRYEDLRKDISAIRNDNEVLKEENVAVKSDLQDAHRKLFDPRESTR